MNGKRYVYTGGVLVLAVALIFFYFLFHRPEPEGQTTPQVATPAYPAAETTHARVHLYFSGPDNASLVAETRELTDSGDTSELGKAIIQALIDGPRGEGIRTLPASAQVRDVFITDDGTAYVDFNQQVSEDHPGGVRPELLSIYSVVDSLALNLENISAVKLLIDGREADTLAGHMDQRYPYKANILLIK
jgi:hypothetical protein